MKALEIGVSLDPVLSVKFIWAAYENEVVVSDLECKDLSGCTLALNPWYCRSLTNYRSCDPSVMLVKTLKNSEVFVTKLKL